MTQQDTDFQVLAISTPEGVRFRIPLAGPAARFLAWFMDALVINSAFAASAKVLRSVQGLNQDLTFAAVIILYFLLNIGYPIAMEWMWRGQSIGKKLFALRVIDAGGKRLEFTQILLRNVLRFVDCLPVFYLIGGISMILSARGQRLGDLVANTVVIRQRKLALPEFRETKNSEQFNSLLIHPHLSARLRQNAPAALAHLAMEAILRRDELTAEARINVFRALAEQFKHLVKFPDETLAGLADERYVRNCLQIILNTGNFRQHVHPNNSSAQQRN